MDQPHIRAESPANAIRRVVDEWIIFSDSGQWERFDRCWHDDGFMAATWFQASAPDFIAGRRAGLEPGVSIIHFNGRTASRPTASVLPQIP